MFPVTFTGLHCGFDPSASEPEIPGVFPVTFTGLHCGLSLTVADHTDDELCSR